MRRMLLHRHNPSSPQVASATPEAHPTSCKCPVTNRPFSFQKRTQGRGNQCISVGQEPHLSPPPPKTRRDKCKPVPEQHHRKLADQSRWRSICPFSGALAADDGVSCGAKRI